MIAPAGHHCDVRSGHLNATFGGKDMGSMAPTGLLLVPSDALGHTWALPGVLGAGQGLPPKTGPGDLKVAVRVLRGVSSRKMASRSHLPTAATAARRLLRHRGAGHRPALGSCRPHWAGFAGNRRRTLLRPRRCDVWRRGAGRQASSPTWSLAGPLGSATRRTSSHELQTATGRHA